MTVKTIDEVQAAVDNTELSLERLRARARAVESDIDTIAEEIHRGKTARTVELTALGAEKLSVDAAIEEEESKLRDRLITAPSRQGTVNPVSR